LILIKPDPNLISDDFIRLISYYRTNPIIAANHLLVRQSEPVTLPAIQQKVLLDWWNGRFCVLTASRGFGKLLSDSTNVLTPDGFKRIDTLNIGDEVITPEGNKSKIVNISCESNPVMFKVVFVDGREIEACKDHQWLVFNEFNKKVLTTEKIKTLIEFGADVYIPLVGDLPTIDKKETEEFIKKSLNCSYLCSGYYENLTKDLALEVQKKLWSLGHVCSIFTRENDTNLDLDVILKDSYEISGLYIKEVLPIESKPGRCIMIEDPEGLYIVDNYIVTHNTFLSALYLALRMMLYPGTNICVFAPSFRQSKLIFAEFEKLYHESPFLQECIDAKGPSIRTDSAYCATRRVGRQPPSILKALPVGNDGSKIRGERAQLILLDEIAQLPEHIFRSAIRPILSTDSNPMENVRRIKELREKYGDKVPESSLISGNSYIGVTSGYYQFNYWWKEICTFYKNIKNGDKKYNLNFIPYHYLPEGFLSQEIVQAARENDPDHVFKTEWCAEWVGDSAGAFPMSLLDGCRDKTVIPTQIGDPSGKSQYIFGVDVARDRDATAIVVIRLGYPNHLIHLAQLESTAFPDQARHLLELINKFRPIKIYMDAGGGGTSLKDYLLDPQSVGMSPSLKVISEDANHQQSGMKILRLVDFSPTIWAELNNNTKTLLEQRALLFPDSTNPIEAEVQTSVKKSDTKKTVDLVQLMINQAASIVITPNASGSLRFDLPKSAGSRGYENKANLQVRRKDLYTALMLAGSCAYELSFKHIEEERKVVSQGIIKTEDLTDLRAKYKSSGNTIFNSKLMPRSALSSEELNLNLNTVSKTVIPNGGIIIKNGNKGRNGKRRR
jgi:hypothetical protein